MADQNQLAHLRQGVEQWKMWRKQHPNVPCDLSGADLSGADLSRANLSGTDLTKADLDRADLYRANLTKADLDGADLSRAILTKADLYRANLRRTILVGANLRRTTLVGANLIGANLSEANLGFANLSGGDLERSYRGADLSGANLRRTILVGANLSNANLSEANLRGADLNSTDFSRANLRGADLSEAQAAWTKFVDIDLRSVKGLEAVQHIAPSNIGIDTLYRSQGQIPESFLRKAGVPEDFLTFLPSLMNHAIEYYTCFISYSSQNEDFARRLYADLQAKGVRSWFAPEDMKIGDKIRQRIDETIRLYDKLLLVLSEQSITSEWVEFEVEAALEKERQQKRTVLFPIRLDDHVMQSQTAWAGEIRRTRHIGKFIPWKDHDAYQQGLTRLLRDLQPERPVQDHDS